MSRLVRAVKGQGFETVMLLGGERGLVALHVSHSGVPQAMVVHSPVEVKGWEGPIPCLHMEVPCWYYYPLTGDDLLGVIGHISLPWEEALWRALEGAYQEYLAGGRR